MVFIYRNHRAFPINIEQYNPDNQNLEKIKGLREGI